MTTIFRSSTTQTNTTLPLSQPQHGVQQRKRFIANPIRQQQKPIPLRPTQPAATATTAKPSLQLSQTSPSTNPALTLASTQPSQPANAVAAGPEIGGMAVTDATTLPRARVLEVTRRLDGTVTRLAIKVQLLATGEEKDIDDRGGGPISVAADIQQGDLITLTPSGTHTFQWQKSTDQQLSSTQLNKPKRKRRTFTMDDLLSPLGLTRILATCPTQRWKGYGHEREDVARLVWLYKVWMSEMFPHAHPAVLTRRMEVMGGTRRVQRYMDVFRYEGRVKGEREQREKRQKVDEDVAVVKEKDQLEQEAAAQLMDEVYGREEGEQSNQDERAAMEEQLLQQQEEEVQQQEPVEPPVGQGSSFDEAMRQLGLLPPLPVDEEAEIARSEVEMDEAQSSEEDSKSLTEARQSETQQAEPTPQLQDESIPHSPPLHTTEQAAELDIAEYSEQAVDEEHVQRASEFAMVPETLEYAVGELDASPHESTHANVLQRDSTAEPDNSGTTVADEIPSSLAE